MTPQLQHHHPASAKPLLALSCFQYSLGRLAVAVLLEYSEKVTCGKGDRALSQRVAACSAH
jgi:hypothetical protein